MNQSVFCLPKHTLVGKQNTTWVSAQRPAALLARAGFPDATLTLALAATLALALALAR